MNEPETLPTDERCAATYSKYRCVLAQGHSGKHVPDGAPWLEPGWTPDGPSPWKPIETAPKMQAILVYNNGYTVAHWNEVYGRWIAFGSDTADTLSLNRNKPTHWMPLPGPPHD